MERALKIDKAVYLVDDRTRTYRYLRRNPEWKQLPPGKNETNKQTIEGYMRHFRDGRTRRYKRAEHP